jgi:di/tripeptidase
MEDDGIRHGGGSFGGIYGGTLLGTDSQSSGADVMIADCGETL